MAAVVSWFSTILAAVPHFMRVDPVRASGPTRGQMTTSAAPLKGRWLQVTSTVGQPIAGSGMMLGHGFWGPHSKGFPAYLPVVLRNFKFYFEGPCEAEPNNSGEIANGPLRSGRVYCGYSNDDRLPDYNRDYFSFYMERSGSITVSMTNHPGTKPQLQLRYQVDDEEHRVHGCKEAVSCVITYNGQPGLYYIFISAKPPYNTTDPYSLQVTYP